MKRTMIDCKVGIYDTEYTMRDYGDKICVTAPYIKWSSNTGILEFKKSTIKSDSHLVYIRRMCAANVLFVDHLTIDDILYYYN